MSLNTKTLKRPDEFTTSVTGVFDKLFANTKVMSGIFILILGVAIFVGLYIQKRDVKSEQARSALFLAQKAMDQDLKAFALTLPKAPEDAKAKKTAPVKAGDPDEKQIEAASFAKIDVNAKFSESVKKLNAVDEDYNGTRAAFESRVALANLYLNHGEAPKAVEWYRKATDSAPNSLERAVSWSSLGYAYENAGQIDDALKAYEKALSLAESGMKGDLLMSLARVYELKHDTTKARSTYDQVLSQLPNTDYAKSAEIYKARLQ